MGFFESVGNAAKRAKLNTEIALLDREMATRKKAFGVELYDIIHKQHEQQYQNKTDGGVLEMPVIFKTIENEIQEPLAKASKEIREMDREKRALVEQMEALGTDASDGMGKRMSDGAKSAELSVKIAYLDREMKLRKEQFGLDVYEAAAGPQWMHQALSDGLKDKKGLDIVTGAVGGLVKGTKGTVTKTLGKVSGDEREIENCVHKAKADIQIIKDDKKTKNRQLEAIIGK